MNIVAILLGIVIAILAGAFIIRPLTEHHPAKDHEADRELSTLQAEQDHLLALIEELDMDHAIGKILADDYQLERSRLMQLGADNLKRMDDLLAINSAAEKPRMDSLEDKLEASVAKLRKASTQRGHEYCRNCGAKVLIGDRFCVACGGKIHIQEDRG